MKNLAASLNLVTDVFGDGAERAVAEKLLGFLLDYPNTKHVNIGLVRQIINDKTQTDQTIVRVLQLLAGEILGVLTLKFEFLDDEGEPRDISKEEAKYAATANINPFSGEEDLDCALKLLIYFEPTGGLRR